MKVDDRRSRKEELSSEEVHLDLPPLTLAVVNNSIHPYGACLGRTYRVDVRRSIVPPLTVTQLGMSNLVSHQECLFERGPTVLVKNQWNLANEGCTPTIKESRSGNARLYGDTELVGDCDRELIGGPRVAATQDCLIVQPLGMLSSELYSVHGLLFVD